MQMPLNTNGMVMTASVTRIDRRPAGVSVGANGMARCATNVAGTPTAKSSALAAVSRGAASGPKVRGLACTRTAPAVIPSNAAATLRNAKWYHMVTLKIRVSRTSYISVAAATANTPPHRAIRPRARVEALRSLNTATPESKPSPRVGRAHLGRLVLRWLTLGRSLSYPLRWIAHGREDGSRAGDAAGGAGGAVPGTVASADGGDEHANLVARASRRRG